MGTDVSDPIGGSRQPPPAPKKKTISAPYQSYQIRVSVANLTELVSVQGAVDGAPTFVKDHNEPWYWFAILPSGVTSSADGSTGAIPGTHGGFYVSLAALLALVIVIGGIAPFTGVNNGTARLLKAINAFELASVQEGDLLYVESVIDYWKWLPTSSEPDNTATECTVCAPTIVGAGLGRFVRMCIASPEVMRQTEWNFASTGSNEATGLPGSPLLTTTERQRRMGPNAQWRPSTAYHIRYLSDGYTDLFQGSCPGTNTVIYWHASTVNFQGAAELFRGVVTSITNQNTATGQPYVVNSADLPVNWAGLIDFRMRVVDGANANALSSPFFQDSGTPKSAWCDDFLTPVASLNAAPFVVPASLQAPPIAGNTFVIETFRQVTRIQVDLESAPGAAINTTRIVSDGIQTTINGGATCGIYNYGSRITTPFSHVPILMTHRSGIHGGFNLNDTGTKSIVGGHIVAGSSLILVNNLPTNAAIGNFTLNGASTLVFAGSGTQSSPDSWRPGQIGVHNHTNFAYLYACGGIRMASGFLPYGLNNTGPLISVEQNVVGISQSGTWTMAGFNTTATNIWQTGSTPARTSLPAFDQTTGLFTAPRLLSRANMAATVAAGGFGENVVDPVTGAGFVVY